MKFIIGGNYTDMNAAERSKSPAALPAALPSATRKHFVVFFGVPLEFSALNLFRVFDWAAKSPTLLLYQQWLYLLIFHFFEPFLEYYKQ